MSTLNGKVCTELCIESCPHPDWKCERVAPPGSEPVYACVPPNSALCRPCANDLDCQFIEGEEGARCIEYGPQGRFCAVECSSSEGIGCLEGFKCQQLKIGGEPIELCMSKQNDCPCLMGFVGLSTRCYNFNEHGTCTGDRVCRLREAVRGTTVPLVCRLLKNVMESMTTVMDTSMKTWASCVALVYVHTWFRMHKWAARGFATSTGHPPRSVTIWITTVTVKRTSCGRLGLPVIVQT